MRMSRLYSLQEMETNKDAYIRYDPTKENAWVQAIFDALGTKSDEYYKVMVDIGDIFVRDKGLIHYGMFDRWPRSNS